MHPMKPEKGKSVYGVDNDTGLCVYEHDILAQRLDGTKRLSKAPGSPKSLPNT